MTRRNYQGVAVAVPVTVPYQRYCNHTAHWWLGRALAALIKKAGIKKHDIDGLCVSSFTLMPDTAVGLMQHLGMSPRWLDHIPMGGACGVVALRRAARAVQAGDASVIACIAGDTNHVDSFRQTVSHFSQFAMDATYPYGGGGPNASFALLTDHYMQSYGATLEDFGKLAVAQRKNSRAFPYKMLDKDLSLEQYVNARVVAEPLRLFDCVMPCAGAEGYLVMDEARAKSLKLPFVSIKSTIERHNAYTEDPIQMRAGWAVDKDELYELAGVGPKDMDFLQTYDDYQVINVMQMEDLGFCEKGQGPEFIRQNTFTHDGSFPFNTSGGQLSMGQAGAAGGYVGIIEAIRQLSDQTLGVSVENAQHGLVSGFGMINYDRGLCTSAAVLSRSGA